MSDKAKRYRKYLRLWLAFSHASFQEAILLNFFSSSLFILGKLFRFLSIFAFLFIIVSQTKTFMGYTRDQVILFFLVFNLVDITVQAVFRGVYWFRGLILSGNFDYFLLKPLHPLFNVLTRYTDFMDVFTLVPLIGYIIYFVHTNHLAPSGWSVLLFGLLLVLAFIIALAFHIISISIGVITTETDNIIWVLRNLSQMARVPIDIYYQAIQIILIFVLPVGIMITFPAKALMGLLEVRWLVVSLVVSLVMLKFSLVFWQWALKRYSSASS
jgi:ABC-2 type transport system permease protein